MLRKDTIYMLEQDCDSKVPSREVILEQVSRTSMSSWIPVRLRMGKVTLGQYENKTHGVMHTKQLKRKFKK